MSRFIGFIFPAAVPVRFHRETDLRTTTEPAEVLKAHAEAFTAKELLPRDAVDVEWLKDAFGVGRRSLFVQCGSPNVNEASRDRSHYAAVDPERRSRRRRRLDTADVCDHCRHLIRGGESFQYR